MFHVFPDSLTVTKESSVSRKARDKVFVINLGIKKMPLSGMRVGKHGEASQISRDGGEWSEGGGGGLGVVSACSSPEWPSEGAVVFELADPRGAEGAACHGNRKINRGKDKKTRKEGKRDRGRVGW